MIPLTTPIIIKCVRKIMIYQRFIQLTEFIVFIVFIVFIALNSGWKGFEPYVFIFKIKNIEVHHATLPLA
jgi:hypothetical protein